MTTVDVRRAVCGLVMLREVAAASRL